MNQQGEFAARRSIGAHWGADGAVTEAADFPAREAGVVGDPDLGRGARGPTRASAKKAVDLELVNSFFDEATEIMGTLNRSIGGWFREPANALLIRELLESLHTLKGGARLCSLVELGELIHGFETFLTAPHGPGNRPNAEVFREVRAHRDQLARALRGARTAIATGVPPDREFGLTESVPFSRLLPKLSLVVRQLGEQLRKRVELHSADVKVELNGGVLKRLAVPIEHMLRNAVDHGIETPEWRRRRGKPETGRIDLRIGVRDGEIVIEVADDGGGIDCDEVRTWALGKGALTTHARTGDLETAELVFAPGVSTAEIVTKTSGRGVGLSAARVAIDRLGGRVGVSFVPGKGTSFSLRIPCAASVENAFILKLRDDAYAIPSRNVEDIVTVAADAMHRLKATGTFEQGGACHELRYLGEFMGLHDESAPNGARTVVIPMQRGARRIAVHADALVDRRDVLVRRTRGDASGTGGMRLATRLDDGSAVVLLDPLVLTDLDESAPAGRAGYRLPRA